MIKVAPRPSMPASVVLPMGRFGPAFLAYDNFQAYLKWNQSLNYSLTAAYYATRLDGAPPMFCTTTFGLPGMTSPKWRASSRA